MSNDYDQYLYEAATDESDYDQYLYESVDDPESTEVNSSYGGDLIDRLQQGVLNVSADVAGAAGRLLGTDRATENYLRDWAQEQEDTISPESKESYQKFGLGEDDEMSWSGFGQHLASVAGSFGPSMLLGGVGGAALRGAGALAKGAKLSDTANKAATAAGYGGAGSLMIGGSTANEVEEGLKQMNHEQLAQLPMFNELHSTIYESMGGTPDVAKASYDQAKKLYVEQMSNEAGLKGGALGAISMGIGGPLMEKLLRFGAPTIAKGAGAGFANEGLQEAFEEGGQARISNPYLGKENWEGVGERAAEGMLLGGVLGGTVGGVRGAFGEQTKRNPDDKPIVDDQGNQIGWRDQKTGETYSSVDNNLYDDFHPNSQAEMDLARKVINPQQNFDDITRIMNMGMDEVDNEINNLLAAPLKLPSPDKMGHAPIPVEGRIDPTGKFGGPGFDEQTRPSIEGELLPEQPSPSNLLALNVDAIEGELAEHDRQSTLLNLGVKNGLISQEEATQVQNNIDNAIKAIGQQPNYQAYLNRQANNKNLANKAAPKGPFEQKPNQQESNSELPPTETSNFNHGDTVTFKVFGKEKTGTVTGIENDKVVIETTKKDGSPSIVKRKPESLTKNENLDEEPKITNKIEELPKPHWAIIKDGRVLLSGSSFGTSKEYLDNLASKKNAEVFYSDQTFSAPGVRPEILGHTWKQIQDMQNKRDPDKEIKYVMPQDAITAEEIQKEQLPLEETQDAIDTGTTPTTETRTDSIQTETDLTQEFQEETRETAKSSGKVEKVITPNGNEVETQFEVLEADDLIDSSMEGFDQALQPRDRGRDASEIQIRQIANNLDPLRLGSNRNAGDGSPIIGMNDNMVEAGNGRTKAIKKAYQSGKADKYKQYLIDNGQQFGVDASSFNQPVLVRRRTQDVDRAKFAEESNQRSQLGMSPKEQAIQDANKLSDSLVDSLVIDDGLNLTSAKSRDFVTGFLKTIGQTEQSEFVTEDGSPNKKLIDRIKSALFYKAYGNSELITVASENTDNELANVVNTLINIAPGFVRVKNRTNDFDSHINKIADGAEQLIRARRNNQKIKDIINQDALFDDKDNDALMWASYFEDNIRSPKRLEKGLLSVSNTLYNEDSSTADMFGGKPEITNQYLFETAKNEISETRQEQDLFSQGTDGNSNEGRQQTGQQRTETKNTRLQEAKERHQLKKQLDELKKFTIPPETVSVDGEDQTIQHGKADKALEKLAERIKQAMDLRGCLYGN